MFLAGWFAVVAAWAMQATACDQPYLATCSNGNLMTLQLGIAGAGLVPAGLMLFHAYASLYRKAMVYLISALVVYGIWALVNDAAVHGWNGLALLP